MRIQLGNHPPDPAQIGEQHLRLRMARVLGKVGIDAHPSDPLPTLERKLEKLVSALITNFETQGALRDLRRALGGRK